jgi:hypothetical protein
MAGHNVACRVRVLARERARERKKERKVAC